MTQAAAEAAIVAAGMTVGTVTTDYSPTVPAGDVISQDPAGGTSAPPGTSVDLVVSLGILMVDVPDVVGLAQAAAEAAITSASLVVGNVTTAYSPTVPAGVVISQNPAGGASIPAGSTVDIEVSLGVEPVTVPNVVGMAQAAAEAAITSASLVVGNVTTAYSPTVPAGDVISQNPAGGSSAAPGTSVDLVVSLGILMVDVPDVVGMTQAAAEAAITSASLIVGNVTTANSETVPAGDVISQNPAGGASIPAGSTVDIEVSLGPASSGDTVTIIKAEYKADKLEFKVEATSSEGGSVTLTVVGYGDMTWKSDKNKYEYKVKDVPDPGATVTVTSTGGGQDTAAVTHK
jgi:beta-lactam-binding protein with PASTA domain